MKKVLSLLIIFYLGCGSGMIGLLEKKPIDSGVIPVKIEPGLYNNEDNSYIGNIRPFSGNFDVVDYYNYYDNTGHPSHAPLEVNKMNLLIYKNALNYYLIFQINKENEDNTIRSVSVSIETTGNDLNDNVIFSDDALELILIGETENKKSYVSIWIYDKDGDGGVIGPFKYGAEAIIKFNVYSDLTGIDFINKNIASYCLLYESTANSIRIEFL